MLNLFKSRAAAGPRVLPTTAGSLVREAGQIVDRQGLAGALAAAADAHDPGGKAFRAAVLSVLKTALEGGRAEIRRRFLEEDGGGNACVAAHAHLMDTIIAALADLLVQRAFPLPNPTLGERLAIVAVGGYGRGELAPQSDLDLLFLLPYKRNPRIEQVVETMLYLLWDLALKVGHAVRSVDECIRSARADMTIRTGLLESRAVWGEAVLHDGLRQRFGKEVVAGTGHAFVEAKLAERDERHRRLGDSRYVLEPNIKEGKGGLRDLQSLYWIGKYLYQAGDVSGLVEHGMLNAEEAARLVKAETFLRTLRCHLHYLAGRPEERLTFDLQPQIAAQLGYTDHAGSSGVERLMKHYFLVAKEVGDLTRIFCAALEAESQRRPRRGLLFLPFGRRAVDGFALEGGRLDVAEETQFRDRPVDMIRLFHLAQHQELDIHPRALKLITRSLGLIGPKLRADPEANRLFLEILTSRKDPEQALRRMSEAGVLGRFVPDFGRVVAQMQYDMYHVFTVDEHTLFAIGILHKIMIGQLAAELPLATRAAQEIDSRRALHVAVLLHDIAKGRGGDHSVIGARIARQLGPRLGLSEEETETAEWLVRWHLLMSDVALKRDIEDDKAIGDFVSLVELPERLRLLLVLTTADIRAVGPGRWNAWKGTLLSQLFWRARALMSGGLDVEGRGQRVAAAQEAVRALLPDWPQAEVEAHLASGYAPYWLAFDAEAHARHALLIHEARQAGRPLTVATRVDAASAVTEVTIHTADHPGLFSRLAGALAVCGATIVDAKIFTMTDGMALDVFNVQDASLGGPFDAPDKLARLSLAIERSLADELRPSRELARRRSTLPSRTRVFRIPPRVLIDNEASRTHTVIEVNARDRPGLLYDVTRALTGLGLQISSAKISTYGARAVDVFYVKDVFGLKVAHEGKLVQIREGLAAALADPDAEPAGEPGPPPSPPAPPARRRPREQRA